jgi:hypothetical protein
MNCPKLLDASLRRSLMMLSLFGLVTTIVMGTESLHAIKSQGSTELTLSAAGGHTVRVSIGQMNLGADYPYRDALLWGGDVGEPPQTALSTLQVKENNEVIFVPLSAYSDLGNVKTGSLDATKEGFTLNLHGGDTAASYDATLSFEHGYLRSRTVSLREFPAQRREKTSYSFPKG